MTVTNHPIASSWRSRLSQTLFVEGTTLFVEGTTLFSVCAHGQSAFTRTTLYRSRHRAGLDAAGVASLRVRVESIACRQPVCAHVVEGPRGLFQRHDHLNCPDA